MQKKNPNIIPISTPTTLALGGYQQTFVEPCKKLVRRNSCIEEFQNCVLGHQANLKESSESKELAEMRLQVLVVVITSDACESKKEIMRLKSDLQSEGPGTCY